MARLNYADSVRRAVAGFGLYGDPTPNIARRPRQDDQKPGPSIWKGGLEDSDLSSLTLYGLFIGRSELRSVVQRDADRQLSAFCGNAFIECDFSEADLRPSDLRASVFTSCSLRGAMLDGGDLRRSTFEGCDFSGTRMAGAVLTSRQGAGLTRSAEQRKAIRWALGEGPEPEGG